MGKQFSMSDAWMRNEIRAKRMEHEEGKQVGWERNPMRTLHDGAGKAHEFKEDAALGFDGQDIHVAGDKVSVLKEECLPGGDINLYLQNENGGTYIQRWAKVGPGRHRSAEKPRRVYGI
jgi:hypothetical protein